MHQLAHQLAHPLEHPDIPTPPPTDPPRSGEPPQTLPPVQNPEFYCGPNTKYIAGGKNQCFFYPTDGAKDLSKIFDKNKSKIIETDNFPKFADKPLASIPSVEIKTPDWFKYWDSKGRFNANKTIGGKVYCECGDCAHGEEEMLEVVLVMI